MFVQMFLPPPSGHPFSLVAGVHMTSDDVRKLPLGLYRVFWYEAPDRSSLAAVGQNSKGEYWFAPTNWLQVPSYNWFAVQRVEPILPVGGATVIQQPEPMDPMIPCLTGWLAGMMDGKDRQDFSIASCRIRGHNVLEITFASGLVVQIEVQEGRPS